MSVPGFQEASLHIEQDLFNLDILLSSKVLESSVTNQQTEEESVSNTQSGAPHILPIRTPTGPSC